MTNRQLFLVFLLFPFLLHAQEKQKFIIGVYNSPSADERGFRNLKTGNFNTIYAANPRGFNPWKPCEGDQDINTFRARVVNMAGEEGLDVFLDGSWAEQSNQGFMASTYNKMDAFKGVLFPAVLGNTRAEGWSLPYTMRYERVISTKYRKKGRYISILPNYADRSELGDFETDDHANYQAYLKLISDKLKPESMTLSHYPMTKGSGKAGSFATAIEKDGFIENLEQLASFGKTAGIPFWANIMGTAHSDRKYAPTFSMYRMMAHAAIAYGAEGIFYYTYSRPCGDNELDESFYGPFVGATYLYDKSYWFAVKRMNKALKYMGPHLLKADWQSADRWKEAATHKVCLDSCELLRIPEYDTLQFSATGFSALEELLKLEEQDSDYSFDNDYKMSRLGYDSVWVDHIESNSPEADSALLTELEEILMEERLEALKMDSSLTDSIVADSSLSVEIRIDSLEETLDSLIKTHFPPTHEYQIVSKKIKEVDVSKNIELEIEGEGLDLIFSTFDYGNENKMIVLTNYNYAEDQEAVVKFDFGDYYKALELTAASQNFSKRFQKHETKIEAGDIRVFILKKAVAEED